MLLVAHLAIRTPLIRRFILSDAFDAHVVSADQARAAIRICLALIFAAHDATLLIGLAFDDITCFMPSSHLLPTIPGRYIGFVVQCREIIDGVTDPGTVTFPGIVGAYHIVSNFLATT